MNFKIMKLNTMSFLFNSVWRGQQLCRFILNGRCYPTKEEREELFQNGKSKTWRPVYIGWIAYKYFAKFKCGHLFIDFNCPFTKDMNLVHAHYGQECETRTYLTLNEIKKHLK